MLEAKLYGYHIEIRINENKDITYDHLAESACRQI